MPGYANWKATFHEERRVMQLEGYDISPTDQYLTDAEKPEDYWEGAYDHLWSLRKKGVRSDYRFIEPESFEDIIESAEDVPLLKKLEKDEYAERIAGAVRGRCAGVVLGKPFELHLSRTYIRDYLESIGEYPLNDYVSAYSQKLDRHLACRNSTRGNIRFVEQDDDINYTILALLLTEKKGFDFSHYDIGMNWLQNTPYLKFWCASRMAYYGMVNLNTDRPVEEQIDEFPHRMNPWRECIDGQIRCDMWGWLNPGDPRAAAELAYRDCSFSLTKNGCYGGMYVAGCLAAALSKDTDVRKIIDGGLSVIPKKSRLAEAVRFVVDRWDEIGDFNSVCAEIEKEFGHLNTIDTVNNLSMVTLALLCGELDYTKTITTAVMCGLDTDCNSGTAGSICGAAVGDVGVPERWTEQFNDTICSDVSGFGQGSIRDMIKRVIEVRDRVVDNRAAT